MRNLRNGMYFLACVAGCMFSFAPELSAQDVLNAWNTNGNAGITADGWGATTVFANLTQGELSRGAGNTATSLANGFASSGWDVSELTADRYFEFFVEAESGFMISLDEVSFRTRRTGTGPTNLQLAFSLNGVDFTPIGSEISGYTNTTDGFAHPPIGLSGEPLLQEVEGRVTFRLYGWGTAAAGGTLSFGRTGAENNDLIITGSVALSGAPINAEPSQHASSFTCAPGSPDFSSIQLTWVDAAGAQLPAAYLVRWSDIGYAEIPLPVDGEPVPNGANALNVIQGIEAAIINDLSGVTTYYFKIFPYTNAGPAIDFKTDESVPETSCATTEAPEICGNESFTNMPANSGSYLNPTWIGDDGITFQATDARTDQTLNGRAVLIRNGSLSANGVLNGIGSLTLTTQREFAGVAGVLTVSVNGSAVGTIPYNATVQTTTINGIDVEGSFDLVIATPGNGDRIKLDDLVWTCFGEPFVANPEPEAHPTAFACTAGSPDFSAIDLSWVDSVGDSGASGYLLLWSDIGFEDIVDPTDGVPVGDGSGALNILPGVESAQIAALNPETTYYFKLFAYSNQGPIIDYKTDGAVPETSCTTAEVFCRFETFENMPAPSGSYQAFSWVGDNGFTLSATDSRTDQTLAGRAVLVRNGALTTASVPEGISSLTVTTQREFSGGNGVLTIKVNGNVIGTAPYSGSVQTTVIDNINLEGAVSIVIETPGNGDRIKVDNLGWFAFDAEVCNPFEDILGCNDPAADNFNPEATLNDESCVYTGCTDTAALNYNPAASNDDGSCYFTLPAIVINEIHYNPCALQGSDFDYEFVELYNNEGAPADISGWVLSGSINLTFPQGTVLAADEYIVIAINASFYEGNGYQVFQWTSGQLGNNSGNVTLSDPFGNVLASVGYLPGSPWPVLANGQCPSLELIDPNLDPSIAANWQSSFVFNGTPGGQNSQNIQGCTNPFACNFNAAALGDDGSCDFTCYGCIYEEASNYTMLATIDDGSCDFVLVSDCPADLNNDGVINASDLSIFLSAFGTFCN